MAHLRHFVMISRLPLSAPNRTWMEQESSAWCCNRTHAVPEFNRQAPHLDLLPCAAARKLSATQTRSKTAMPEWRWKSEGSFVCQQRSAEGFEQDAVERIGLWVVFGVPLDAKGK